MPAACAEQCVYACLIKKDEMVSKEEKQCMSLSMFATFATQISAPDEVKYIIIPN